MKKKEAPINLHHEKLDKKKVRLITLASFLFGFSLAVTSYVTAFYFQKAAHIENVGFFYFASYAVVIVSLLNLHKLIKKIGKTLSVEIFSFVLILSSLSLIIFEPSWYSVIFLITYIIFGNLLWVGFDVMLESCSVDKMSGRIRGLFLTISNAGFMLGPFLSMRLLEIFGFDGIFSTVFVINIIIFIIIVLGLKRVNHVYKRNLSILELLAVVRKRSDVLHIYWLAFILDFFYATMIIYSPIYLKSLGFGLSEIGIIFTIMLVPFVLFQYPAGRIADKKWGEKELLIFAIFVMSLSSLAIFFINSKDIVIWAAVLFVTRIGAALLEVLRDSYFYKRIDGADVEIIDFFRTSRSVAYICFATVSSLLMFFVGLKFIFALLFVVVFSGFYPAFKLVDNFSESELK